MKKEKADPPKRGKASLKALNNKRLHFKHVNSLREKSLLTTDVQRAERLREVFQALYEINNRVPIVVEGKRDVQALRRIGFAGEIITIHGGRGLYEFCEDVAEKHHRVVLLLDWDEKGEELFRILSHHLKGLWEVFSAFREIIKLLCQKDIKDIEGIPGLLERLAGTEVTVGEAEEEGGW